MNFFLVHIVKIKFTRNTIPNAITQYTINQEPPIYLFLSHIFSITKQTQNAIFQNQPNKPTFSLSFLVFLVSSSQLRYSIYLYLTNLKWSSTIHQSSKPNHLHDTIKLIQTFKQNLEPSHFCIVFTIISPT